METLYEYLLLWPAPSPYHFICINLIKDSVEIADYNS